MTNLPPSGLVTCPVTPGRWDDLVALFGQRGACGGCWCMCWRVTAASYRTERGEPLRERLHARVAASPPPGVLLYAGSGTTRGPIGWCSIAPREEFPFLARSRVLARVDAQPAWSITCLFVAREWRGRGAATLLVRGAVEFARTEGATLVEAYPVDRQVRSAAAFLWTGVPGIFHRNGFAEVMRRTPTRPILRLPSPRSPR